MGDYVRQRRTNHKFLGTYNKEIDFSEDVVRRKREREATTRLGELLAQAGVPAGVWTAPQTKHPRVMSATDCGLESAGNWTMPPASYWNR